MVALRLRLGAQRPQTGSSLGRRKETAACERCWLRSCCGAAGAAGTSVDLRLGDARRSEMFLRPDTHNRATPLSSAHPHSAALSQQRRLTRTAGRHRRTNSKRSGSRARWRQEDARARHASRQLRAQRAGQGHAPYQRAHARRSRMTVGVGIGWEPSARRHATAEVGSRSIPLY